MTIRILVTDDSQPIQQNLCQVFETEIGSDSYDVLQHNDRVKIDIGDVSSHSLKSKAARFMEETSIKLQPRQRTRRASFMA